MQLFFDIIPILIFFICYKLFGIYVATGAAIFVSALQVIYFRAKNGRFEKLQLVTLILIFVLGGATLWLHKPIYIKWKPTVIYWVFALGFVISGIWGKKPLIQSALEAKIQLPASAWKRLNWSWCAYFFVLGLANLYVIYHFSTDAWVNFKLFGTMILTLLFVVLQAFYLNRFLEKKS